MGCDDWVVHWWSGGEGLGVGRGVGGERAEPAVRVGNRCGAGTAEARVAGCGGGGVG